METKYIWFVVFSIALIIGGVFYFSTHSSTSPTNSTENNQFSNSSTNPPTVFYTQVVANIRSCSSTSCASLGTYPINTDLSLPYTTVDDLPEWIGFSFLDSNDVTQTGYINKSTLGTNKVNVIVKQQVQKTSTPTYAQTNSSCKLKAE